MRTILFIIALACTWPFGSVCAKYISNDQREAIRDEIDQAAENTISVLTRQHPDIQAELDVAVGWLAARLSGAQVVVLGGGFGNGVLVDASNLTRTYMDVRRLEVGPAFGAGILSALVVFHDRETLEAIRRGTWQSSLGGSAALDDQGGVGAVARSEHGGFSLGHRRDGVGHGTPGPLRREP